MLLAFLLFVGFQQIRNSFYPPPPPEKKDDKVADVKGAKDKQNWVLPDQPKPTPEPKLIALGDETTTIQVVLDPRGAGVRQVTLTHFRAANEDGKPTNDLLELVPPEANTADPAHLLYHFEGADAKRPKDTLGVVTWETRGVETEEVDGKPVKVVRFTKTHDSLKYTKKYSLAPGDYHLGLEVTVERPATEKTKARVRYQLVGAKGLPVEGKWFASKFRNAVIGLDDGKGWIERDFQELSKIILWGNGNSIANTEKRFIRYAGVECQYFASVIVVSDDQVEGQDRGFLASARPTLESGVVHGRIKGGPLGDVGDRISILSNDGKTVETVYLPTQELRDELRGKDEKSGPIAILYRNLGYDVDLGHAPKVALEIYVGREAEGIHSLWEDDITVRVNTKPIDLEPGKSVTHRYLLYNGPVKPSLLKHLGGDAKVDQSLLKLYVDDLHLNTMTDYQSPGFFGHVWYNTGVTWLVISITNVVHWALGHLYYWIPNLGLCIIVLTVLIRGLMYPLSRKQAIMGLKMQALAPEMKKLQAKHGDDKLALQQAQWDLFKKHGVNPLGSCWILLLQMPIFMGLWYALQESIIFRLAPFWPTWVVNLAAPDMLLGWGRSLPIISSDAAYGGFLYLGPYLNILPIVAVVLMSIQQQMMTPPPADEQQEMQQTMMKYMMIFFGLMFYKVAAGLCVYYIATTLWGFAERALLPKATLVPVDVDLMMDKPAAGGDKVTGSDGGAVLTGKKKNKKRTQAKEPEPEATPFGKWRQGWAEWWKDVLEQARKK